MDKKNWTVMTRREARSRRRIFNNYVATLVQTKETVFAYSNVVDCSTENGNKYIWIY